MSPKIEKSQIEEISNEQQRNNILFLKSQSNKLQELLENNEPKEEWQVIWDIRDKLIDNKEDELKSLAYVDEVTNSIKSKNIDLSPFIDEELILTIKTLVTLVQRRRFEQNKKPWNKDQMKIFIYEMVNTPFLSKDRVPRKDGSKYWLTHLVGSVINAVCDSRITSLSSLIALLRHDDFEDLAIHKPKRQKDLLMCEKYYFDELESDQKQQVFKRQKEMVYRLVTALSNLKRGDEADFIAFVQQILDVGIRVAILRNAERSHNLDTVSAHGSFEKIQAICHESMNIHARMTSSILKMDDVEEHIFRSSLNAINPAALERFANAQKERLNRFFGDDPDASNIMLALSGLISLSPVEGESPIQYLAIRPIPFTKYLDKSNITKEDPFLKIDDSDPMFEILILTDGEPDEFHSTLTMLKVRCEVMNTLGESVGKPSSWIQMKVEESIPNLNPDKGDSVQIYNPTLGGKVHVRINNVRKEALRPRGIISENRMKDEDSSNNEDVEMPESMYKNLVAAVKRFKQSPIGFFEHLESILADPIIVRSRDDEPVELQRGSNGIDYAGKIHSEVLKGFRAIKVALNALEPARFVSPFYVLKDGEKVVIITDPNIEIPKEYEYSVDLSWRCFAGLDGIDALKNVYSSLGKEQALEKGSEYVSKLSHLFGFQNQVQFLLTLLKLQGKENLIIEYFKAEFTLNNKKLLLKQGDERIDTILGNYRGDIIQDINKLIGIRKRKETQLNDSMNDLLLTIGNCKIDPVELLANTTNLDTPVVVQVEIPNLPGSLDSLTREIKEFGVNIVNIEQINIDKNSLVDLSLVIQDHDQHTNYDLLKCILRLMLERDVTVRSNHFTSQIPTSKVGKRKTKTSAPQQSE